MQPPFMNQLYLLPEKPQQPRVEIFNRQQIEPFETI